MQTMEQNQNDCLKEEILKEHPIIFFDGVCGFCNRSVNFVLSRDKKRVFRFAPLQGEPARQCLAPECYENLNNMVLLDETGQYPKSSAAVRILQKMGGFWSLLGTLLWLIPRPIRNAGYMLVAKFRYQLFGKMETCRIPSQEEQDQFLP